VFHRRDLRIVETFRAFAASDDDVAFVKFETDKTGDVALRFSGERLRHVIFRTSKIVNYHLVFIVYMYWRLGLYSRSTRYNRGDR
jgi:hypothetical protein